MAMSLAQKLQSKLSHGMQETSPASPQQKLKDFIAVRVEPRSACHNRRSEDPKSVYTFDSERDAPRSELCREGGEKGRKCIEMEMYATQLFQAMQDQGFYCALPTDPTRTHMECKPIPKD
ncbi:hypothetical protein BC628DRAFT_1415717 [Trametes gibbosa]|nr:hypothetical protein BC628DRAFT_1415717 [Trametes gibbosa]